MSRMLKQLVIALVFIALLGFADAQGGGGLAGVWRWLTGGEETPRQALDNAEALRRYGFVLNECARDCGLDFLHESPTLDPKLEHIMALVAAMNASVSVIDFDGDGWLDLYVVTGKEGGKNRLYRNKGDGTFEDVA